MPRATLLDTRTVNYQELIGNGKAYVVPAYQRDYSWSQEQWEDLWNDLIEVRDAPDGRHYMGALVVEARTDREFVVIDGQQRLATLSVLILAVIQALDRLAGEGIDSEKNRARAKELRNRFVGEKDPASLVESSRLRLNATDDGFYQDYLVRLREPANPRGLVPSNGLLWQCSRYFLNRIRELDSLCNDGTQLAKLVSEAIARRLTFIQITVDDALNAYTVFETLNARGLELTTTDLLKNYIFSRASVPDRAPMLRQWQRVTETVGQAHVPDLLRYHMLCELPKVRRRRLFKLVRDRYTSASDVLDLLGVLERRAELFAAISDPLHGFWVEDQRAREYVSELSLFRVKHMLPVLFATREKWSPGDFLRALKLVTVLAFRYAVVGRLYPNQLEPVYHGASKAVMDGQVTTPRQLFDRLRPIYLPDEQTENSFSFLAIPVGGPRKRLVKHILARLEEDISGKPCDARSDPGTIEHILPENPDSSWEHEFPEAARDGLLGRIGNLTLLEAGLNREVGNAPYRTKRDAYTGSRYELTRQIAEMAPEEWTPRLLELRQRRLAKRVVRLWRSDFA